jgi:phospholipid transport system substrate-binding protein
MLEQRDRELQVRVSKANELNSPVKRAYRIHPWVAFVLAALLVGDLPPALGEPLNEPQQVVQRVSEGLRRVLRENHTLLQSDPAYVHRVVEELFLPHLDFRRTCAIVLGPFWKKASVAQREAFGTEFKSLLINTYATAVNELSEWEIRYLPFEPGPGDEDVVVRTRVLSPTGEPIGIDYRMHLKGKRWLAYDVKVAGVSLLANYRSTFARMAREKGVAGLIDELAARNARHKNRSH